jgi:hypothetical protein
VLRSAVFILMMLCFMSAFSAPVAARPADPDSCHFTDGFLAFREALGEGIVGECESNQTYDRFGHARQTTSEGTLFWDRRRNLVSFHSGSHLWMDGPGGIASHVTIGGLSDKHAERASVSASATVVLELASLRAGDLDGAWWYGQVDEEMPRVGKMSCEADRPDPTKGALFVWMVDKESDRSFVQSLTALSDVDATQMRGLAEADAATCDGYTEETPRGRFVVHMKIESFLDLGDDSMLYSFAVENTDTGERRGSQTAYVRYGGLLSSITPLSPAGLSEDEARAHLEQLTRAAHARIQTAAWYLRR